MNYIIELSKRIIDVIPPNYHSLSVDEKISSVIDINYEFSLEEKEQFVQVNVTPRFEEFKAEAKSIDANTCSEEKLISMAIEYDFYRLLLGHLNQNAAEGKEQHRYSLFYLKGFLNGGIFAKSEGNGDSSYGHGLRGDFMVGNLNNKLYSNRTEEILALVEGDASAAFNSRRSLSEDINKINLWEKITLAAFFGLLLPRTEWDQDRRLAKLENLDEHLFPLILEFSLMHQIRFLSKIVPNLIDDSLATEKINKIHNIEYPIFLSAKPIHRTIHENYEVSLAAPFNKNFAIIFRHKNHLDQDLGWLLPIYTGQPGVDSYRDPKSPSIRFIGYIDEG